LNAARHWPGRSPPFSNGGAAGMGVSRGAAPGGALAGPPVARLGLAAAGSDAAPAYVNDAAGIEQGLLALSSDVQT